MKEENNIVMAINNFTFSFFRPVNFKDLFSTIIPHHFLLYCAANLEDEIIIFPVHHTLFWELNLTI